MAVTQMSESVALARRHAAWRWSGAVLLPTGLLLLAGGLLQSLAGGSGWNVMLGLFSSGLGLASFGANHDTAMAHVLRARGSAGLPAALLKELDDELARTREGDPSLRPSPRVALALPVVALAVQLWVASRLFLG